MSIRIGRRPFPQTLPTPAFELFRTSVGQCRSGQEVVDLFMEQVVSQLRGTPALGPYGGILMDRARYFNDNLGDVDSAIKIWQVVHREINASTGSKRVIHIMLAIAHRITDAARPKEDRDVDTAIKIWRAAHDLDPGDKRTLMIMMDVAGKFADHDLPKADRDVDSAVKLWLAVYAMNFSKDNNRSVVHHMFAAANRLADQSSPLKRDIASAVKIWLALYQLNLPGDDGLRVLTTLSKIVSRSADRCLEGIEFITKEKPCPDNSFFYVSVLTVLYYLSGQYEQLIAAVDASRSTHPYILGLKADALRKTKKIALAVGVSSAIIKAHADRKDLTPEEVYGLMSAFTCRGYCYGRMGNRNDLMQALDDLTRSVEIAREHGLQPQLRAITGLGYIYKRQGKIEAARLAFEQVLEIDPDNSKALQGLRELG